MIKSPLTGRCNCNKIKEINTKLIIYNYKKLFNIDVSHYFNNLKFIQIYECLDTGLKFYYPYSSEVCGDSFLYENLEKNKWYYRADKWEQNITLNYILSNNVTKVLEFGCGKGLYLDILKKYGITTFGIEINEKAINEALLKGHIIFNGKNLAGISKKYIETFDLICSFQVFEHINNPNFIIKNLINMLKPHGKLIISVPNNNSYIKYDGEGVLNMPPHHILLWDEKSLKNFGRINNLKIVEIIYEPLQKEHYSSYYKVVVDYFIKLKLFSKLIRKFTYPFAKFFIDKFSNSIKGQNILIIYQK